MNFGTGQLRPSEEAFTACDARASAAAGAVSRGRAREMCGPGHYRLFPTCSKISPRHGHERQVWVRSLDLFRLDPAIEKRSVMRSLWQANRPGVSAGTDDRRCGLCRAGHMFAARAALPVPRFRDRHAQDPCDATPCSRLAARRPAVGARSGLRRAPEARPVRDATPRARCLNGVAHFAHWMAMCRLPAHLPRRESRRPVPTLTTCRTVVALEHCDAAPPRLMQH